MQTAPNAPTRALSMTGWLSWVVALALAQWIIGAPLPSWGSSDGAHPKPDGVGSTRHPDPAIRHALSRLSTPVPVPVEVVDVGRLPQSLRNAVRHSCAFVRSGNRRIYITSSCPAYRRAESSVLDSIKLAALLRHELAHLEGADEARARLIEARTFRALLADGPPESQTPGMFYAVALERLAAPGTVSVRQVAVIHGGAP